MNSNETSAFGRNRGRRVLTVFSVAISVLLIVGLTSLSQYLDFARGALHSNPVRLVTHHGASLAMPIPVSYAKEIRKIPGVKTVMPVQWIMGIFTSPAHRAAGVVADNDPIKDEVFTVYAVDPDPSDLLRENNLVADPVQVAAFREDLQGALVGEGLLSDRGWKVGDTIRVREQGFPFDANLTIRGTYGPRNRSAFIHYEYLAGLMNEQVPEQAGLAQVLTSVVNSPADAPRVASAIDAMFSSSLRPTRTESEQDFLDSFSANQGNVSVFFLLIGFAVGLGGLFVLMNTMAISTEERSGEISHVKVHMSGFGVLQRWITESLWLALAGGALGIGTAAVIILFVSFGHITGGFVHNLPFNWDTAMVGFAATVLLGLGGGLIPALKAASAASPARQWLEHGFAGEIQ